MSRALRVLPILLAGAALALAGCQTDQQAGRQSSSQTGGTKELSVVATTGYLQDAVRNIAPAAKVKVLVGPGGDPHTQALTTADAEAIEKADLVVWTSHDMEHQMMAQLDKLGAKQLAAAEAIPQDKLLPWEEDGKIEGHDPHVWNSPEDWTYVVNAVATKLGEIDKPNKDTYQTNASRYNQAIRKMAADAKQKFDTIPANQRILVTGHDAFNYLGKSFGLEIHATDFVSSEAQMSAKQIDELATLIADKKVRVIFQDNLSNPDAIKHLKEAVAAKGGSVEISDKPLFADSLGESAPTDTYLGAFQYNVDAIVQAMNGQL